MRSDWPRAGRCVSDNFAVPGTAVGAHRRGNDPARNTCSTDVNAPPQAIPSISLQRGILYFQMPIVHRLEHFSVDWPKERARRQYEQYGEREATQGISLKNTLDAAQALDARLPIQIEVETLAQLEEALDCRASLILLDNFTLDALRAAVQLTAQRAALEVSGGVDLHTVRAIADTGVDRISVGALTKHVRAIDYSMRLI